MMQKEKKVKIFQLFKAVLPKARVQSVADKSILNQDTQFPENLNKLKFIMQKN